MTIRKEQDINVHGTEYRVKHLPATIGAGLFAQISKLFFSGAGAVGDLLQDDRVKELFQKFFTSSLVISDVVLEDLPPQIKAKLQPLKGEKYPGVAEIIDALSENLSKEEVEKYYGVIAEKAAVSSNPDFSSILSVAGHLLELLKSVLHKIDPEEFAYLLASLINNSVIRYRPEGEEKFRRWINKENNYAFDDHFAGRYGELLELFVYLALFNYADSVIMLKKNQISTYIKPYLDMLKPKAETPNSNE